jgi:Flp pilus assembly protein TadG
MLRAVRNKSRKGSTILEFAIVAPMLVLLLAGSFTIGMSLVRASQLGQVCRNANVLVVRGINLAQSQNQQLVVRTASGLGMNITGTNTPDPAGKAVVILTRVLRVGNNACNAGISNWDQNPSSCANHGSYVITSRILIGNQTRWASVTGTPASALQSDGTLSDADIATNTGNRATGFPGIIALSLDEFTFIAEAFADTNEIRLFGNILPPEIRVRNLS